MATLHSVPIWCVVLVKTLGVTEKLVQNPSGDSYGFTCRAFAMEYIVLDDSISYLSSRVFLVLYSYTRVSPLVRSCAASELIDRRGSVGGPHRYHVTATLVSAPVWIKQIQKYTYLV